MADQITVNGLRELQGKLRALGRQNAGRALRQAAMLATTPALRAIRRAAPRGKKPHRTYKGRLVAPGFLARSVVRRSRYKSGRARVEIGVRREAFYGVRFVEQGTRAHEIPKRRKRGASKRLAFGGRVVGAVHHPGARARPWLRPTFERHYREMTRRFAAQLRRKIEKLSD